jgi:hypothetical protein
MYKKWKTEESFEANRTCTLLLWQHPSERKIMTLIDTSSLMKFGEELLELPKLGYQLLLIPENIREHKFLCNSVARQIKEGFMWHNPLRILSGAKVIDTGRPEIKEEREKIYKEVRSNLNSPWKKHSHEDADFTFLAVAKIWNVEIVVSDDKRLRHAVKKLGIRARIVDASNFRGIVAERKKLMRELNQKEQVEKPKNLVKCFVCGKEVESGPAYLAHFKESHSPEKAKKPQNFRKKIIRKSEKPKYRQRAFFRVTSYTACTNVNIKDSKVIDDEHRNNQVAVTQSSNENQQRNEMALVETQMKENSEIVRIYRPLGGL